MSPRYLPSRDYLAIKAAFRDLLRRCGGGHRAAGITRVDEGRLSRYGAPHEAMFAPLDVAADLEADAESPVVTRVLADIAGYLLVAKPAAGAARLDAAALGWLAKEQGEALAAFGEALADGKVTAAEAPGLRKEIMEAMTELARIDAALRHLEGCEDE